MDFIKVRFPDQSDLSVHSLLRPGILQEFVGLMEKKYRSKKRIRLTESFFDQFRLYMTRKGQLQKTEDVLPKKTQELVLEYLTALSQKDIPPVTVRNYKSDVMQFFQFLTLQEKMTTFHKEKHLSQALLTAFAQYLSASLRLSPASVKRKTSVLRSFSSWAASRGYFSIEKPTPEATEKLYQKETIEINHSSPPPPPAPILEIKDRRNYINTYIIGIIPVLILILGGWYLFSLFFPSQPPAPPPLLAAIEPTGEGRIIKYEGKLRTRTGEDVVQKQLARFRLWDMPTGGSSLYDSQICPIETDQKGVFSVLIGSSCGAPIPSSVFTNARSLYIGVSIEDEEEMSPRQAVPVVGYAADSQTIQGHRIQSPAGPSSIPYIDSTGQLSIAASSPIVKSTAGTFTLEGRSILLKTAIGSNGSLTLAPDNGGTVNLLFTAPMTSQAPGFATIANPNILSGSLLHVSGSPLTSGYTLLELISGDPAKAQFIVDAGGNTTIAGALSVGDHLTASSSGIIANAPFIASNQIYDGGLGIFGTKGNALPVAIDFTKSTRTEFDFKTGSTTFHVDININDDRLKFYRAHWTVDGNMGISQCTPTCLLLGSTSLPFTANAWHHGYLSLSTDGVQWDIDSNKGNVRVPLSKDIPLISKGYVRFPNGAEALSNLRLSQTTDTILTAGNGQLGGNVIAGGSVLAEGQLRPGSFSSAPTTAGNGAMYFNTTDNSLYYWNGKSWVATGTSTSTGKVTIVDTSQEQLRLSYDDSHYARLTSSSSGALAIDPTTDLLISGNLSVGSGGLLYPSENGTHAEQQSYFLSADTSGAGLIRTNASGFAAGGSDFAERFLTEETLVPGDVVRFVKGETNKKPLVGKSMQAYAADIVGVVSDRAAFVGGVTEETDQDKTAVVGLIGQVPVTVTTANGPIRQGDPLTSSHLPGIAMRATSKGPIIGRAMEDFTGDVGTVLTFIRNEWHDGTGKTEIAGDLLTLPATDAPQTDPPIEMSKIPESFASFFQSHIASAKEIVARYLQVETAEIAELRSGTITTEQLQANVIKPLPTDTDLTIALPSSPSGFGQFLIENDQEETVASIDAAGNATFSGTVTAQQSDVQDLQVHHDATIAGTLYADSIVSKDVQSLQASFSTLLNRVAKLSDQPLAEASESAIPVNTIGHDPSLASSASASIALGATPTPSSAPVLDNYQSDDLIANEGTGLSNSSFSHLDEQLSSSLSLQQRMEAFLATSSAFIAQSALPFSTEVTKLSAPVEIPKDLSLAALRVIGSTTLADTAIAGQLFIDGNLILENHSITSLSDTLNLTAEKAISLMGSKLIVDASGNLTTAGTLIANGVITDSLKSKTGSINIDLSLKTSDGFSDPLAQPDTNASDTLNTTSLPDMLRSRTGSPEQGPDSFGTLHIRGPKAQPVTTIDAYGNIQSVGDVEAKDARFSGSLSLAKLTVNTSSLASESAQVVSDGNALGIRTHDTAGSVTIPAGATQFYIYADDITEKSLVYLTPTSSTQSRSLYVGDKVPGSHFIVALDSAVTTDVRLNWWIIN